MNQSVCEQLQHNPESAYKYFHSPVDFFLFTLWQSEGDGSLIINVI